METPPSSSSARPGTLGLDVFKIAGASISGYIPSYKTGYRKYIRQSYTSLLEQRLLLYLEYHPHVRFYQQGDLSPAYDAEVDARAHTSTVEQLVREAQETVKRERTEIDRLRSELDFARTHVEQANIRAEAERTATRETLERERAEVDRLRSELPITRTRADHFATLSDELRTQILQI